MNPEKNPNEIDVSKIDLEKMREKIAENPGLIGYAHSVGGVVIKPEDEGKMKGRAIEAMYQQTDMQVFQIYQQMELLAKQAKQLENRMKISERIYKAEMPSEPIIGKYYYLYQKNEEKDIMSLVAPNEWGRSYKYQGFIAKVRLLADHTWEIAEEGELMNDWKDR